MDNSKRRNLQRGALLAAFALLVATLPFDFPIRPTGASAGPAVVETYFIPLPEEDIRGGSLALYASTSDEVHTVISITGAVNGTIVYYDHWEDGFELDLANPVQATTEVWGDGLHANGAPPTCGNDACDQFGAGDNAALVNDVFANPRDPDNVLYDGGDQVGATGPVAVTRAGWALDPGTLLAGAVEVYPTDAWGTSYIVPMGEDSAFGENFEFTAASIMAASGGTTVAVDIDGDTVVDQTIPLAAGESALVAGLSEGATITANGPLQVDMLTGDVGATYAGRWFALLPTAQWATSYFNPVGTLDPGHPSTAVLYNPTGSDLTVTVDHETGTDTVLVPADGAASYEMPASGAEFSAVAAFYATVLVDYSVTTSDWGFTLVPETRLSTAAVVGWGPGSNDTSSENSSPVWVTPEGAAVVYVDYDGDPTTGSLQDGNGDWYDVSYSMAAFEMQRLYDSSDNDQTGLKVYTLDGTRIAVAYGQDPSTASPGAPALDLGTTVVPLVLVALGKIGSLSGDTNGNGALDPGEFITYTVTIRNDGTAEITPALFTDDLDPNTTYVPGTTTIDGLGHPDSGTTPFPFDEGGEDLGTIVAGQLVVITYDVQLNDPLPDGTDSIVNNAQLNSVGISIEGTSTQPVFDPILQITKTSDVPMEGAIPGDVITYTLDVENISLTPQDRFSVVDVVPSGTTYVPDSTSVTGPVVATETYADDMESGGYGGSTGSLFWGPDWTEINESDGVNAGDERSVSSGGSLRLRVQDNDNSGEGLSRAVDLSGYDTATLSFDFARSGFDNENDFVTLAANDGSGTWDDLATWAGPGSDPLFLSSSHSLDAYLTAGAEIRFLTSPSLGSSDRFMFDNVTISASTVSSETLTNAAGTLGDGTAPNLVVPDDPFGLDPGESMTITFQVQVDDPLVPDITELTNTAYAASYQQPTYTDDSVTDAIAFPEITLAKTLLGNGDEDASGDVTVGDTLTYQFVAENTGDTPLADVEVTDPMAGLSALSCSPPQPAVLAIGEALTCTATYSVTQADVNGSRIDNTASVAAEDPVGRPVNDEATETVPINPAPAVTLAKSLLTDLSGVAAGTVFDYEFVVTNTGNVDLTNVLVSDPMLGGVISCPQNTLAPNGTMTCTSTYTVTQGDVDAGQIANTATVTAEDPTGSPISDTDDELAILEQSASIDLAKSLDGNADEDGSGSVSLNDTLSYEFVATNDGNVTLTNVVVVDPLPGLSAVACAPAAGSSLAPGVQMTCSATYTVTQGAIDLGVIENTATVTGSSVSGADVADSADESVATSQNPSITLVKSFAANADEDFSGDVSLNDTLTYSFEVVNDGNVTLTVVTLTDPLPGLSAFACGPDSLPVTMAPGATLSCTADYVVIQADVDAGRIDNTATASGLQPDGSPIADSDDETVFADRNPSIDLTKTLASNADEDGSGDVSLGDTLTYQFDATNDGDVGLDNVTIVDPLSGLSGLVCSPAQGASLAPAEVMTCTATYVVSQADVDAGQIVNTAIASGDDSGGGGSVSDADSATISTAQNPSIDLAKSYTANADEDGSGDVSVGDTLSYEMLVENAGDVTLTQISVDDPLTGGVVACPVTSLAPGAAMTCDTTYVVLQADVDAGFIANTATVAAEDPSGNPVGDSDDELVSPPQNPSVLLTKILQNNADEDLSGSVSVGDTLTYQLVAANDGDVTLDLVVITDPLPGLSAPICTPAGGSSLVVGGSMDCVATYTVTQGDVDAGSIDNTAVVTAERPGGDPGDTGDDVSDHDDHSVLIPAEPEIALSKSVSGNADEDGSGDVTIGDTLSYEFLVTNIGNVTLDSIDVSDPLIALVSCPISVLAPGGNTTCTADHVVTADDAAAGFVINTATASGRDPGGEIVTDDDAVAEPVVINPAISITKTMSANADEDGSGGISIADTLTYSFVATNTGDVTLSAARIVDPLSGLSALTCTPGQPAVLAPGEALTCSGTYVVTQTNVDQGQIINTATAEGFAPDSSLVSAEDTNRELVAQSASVSLHKAVAGNADEDASGGITRDDTLTYQFEATNSGNVTLFSVAIADPLPGLGALSCVPAQPVTLAPGATITCTADYVVTQTDVDASEIANTATVNALDPDSSPVSDSDSLVTPIEGSPAISLDKLLAANADEDGSGDVSIGDTLTYQFDVQNTGDVSLSAVTLSDPLPGLSTISCSPAQGATLTPSETMRCTADYTVTAADTTLGQISNTATVVGLAPAGTPTSDDDTETVLTARADLSLFKSVSDATPNVGDTVTYILTLVNDGPDSASDVQIVDILPAGVEYDPASIAGGNSQDDTGAPSLVWTVSSIGSGASMNLTYGATILTPTGVIGEYENVAEVTASSALDPDSTPANDDGDQSEDDEANATVTPQSADLSLAKTISDATPDVGDTVTFTVTVSNDGPNDATGVQIVDTVPNGFGGVSNISSGGVLAGSAVTWSGLSITSGASTVVTFDAVVAAPPGSYDNRAEVGAADQLDPDSTPGNDDGDQSEDDEDSATAVPTQIDLSLTKTVSATTPNVGDTVTFTVTLANAGPDVATDVEIVDVVPAGFSGISNISNGGGAAGPAITWSALTIADGAAVALTFDAVVDAPTGASGEYTNTAQVTAADQYDADSTPGNDDGDQSEDDEDLASVVPQQADLSLVKAVSDSTPLVDEVVTFSLTINNAGPDAATGVAVSDLVPNGYYGISAVSDAGVAVGNTVAWSGLTVPAGGSITVTFDAAVAAPPAAYLNMAEITAVDQFDPDSSPNNDDGDQSEDDEDNVGLMPTRADLELAKSVSDVTPNVGDVVTFTITLTNQGPDDATGVAIADDVPSGFSAIGNVSNGGAAVGSTVAWSGLAVSSGGSLTLTFDATVDPPGGGGPSEYLNTTEVTGADQFDPDSIPGNDDGDQSEDDEASVAVTPLLVDLSLTKSVSNATPDVGDTVTFLLTVANAGPDAAQNVVVTDSLPAGFSYLPASIGGGDTRSDAGAPDFSWTISTLASGASTVLTLEAIVGPPTSDPAEYTNTAQVAAVVQFDPDSTPNNDDGDQSEDDEDVAVVVPQEADLSLSKSVSESTPNVGDTVTFSISVSNDGPDDATGVAVVDSVPTGYGTVSNVSSGGSIVGSTVSWAGLAVPSSGSITLTFDAVVVAPPGTYLNVAEITASDRHDRDSAPGNDDGDQSEDDEDAASVVPQLIDLSLVKSISDPAPNVGDAVVFTIGVANSGPDTATGVVVTDTVPAGYTSVSNVSAGGSAAGSLVTWSGLVIPVGGSVTLTFEAVVAAPTGAIGEYLNIAEVAAADQFDGDSTPGNDDGDQSEDDEDAAGMFPQAVDLSLTKTVSDTTPALGATVTYTIVVSNDGPDDATGVAVSDSIPTGLAGPTTISGGGVLSGSTITWSNLAIPAGSAITLTFAADILPPTGVADEYLNTAQVLAADQRDVDSTPGNDDGDQSEDDEGAAALTPAVIGLAKSISSVVNNGDGRYTVTYQLMIKNHGSVDVADLELFDDLAGQFSSLTPSSFVAIDGTLLANPVWDGSATSNLLLPGQGLGGGGTGTVSISLQVTPVDQFGPHDNVAFVVGTTPSGSLVGDQSTDGIDPDADGDDGDGTVDGDDVPDEDDPTPVSFDEAPLVGIAKMLSSDPVGNGDGSFELAYRMVVSNLGDVELRGLQVADDLAVTYAAAQSWSVVSVSSDSFTVATTFDGSAHTDLLSGTDTLAVGATGTIDLVVAVVPAAELGPYWNSATTAGTSPAGTTVADISQDGVDVDPDGNGDPTDNNDPTPVTFPALGIVSGTVWNDSDASTTLDPTEILLAGVTVQLIDVGADGIVGTGDDSVVATTVTVADGSFEFLAVPAGDYAVVVDEETLPSGLNATFDPDLLLDHATPVTVVAGGEDVDNDFGYVGGFNLVLTKTLDGEAQLGAAVDFVLVVRNEGPATALGPIVVTDEVPEQLPVVAVSADGWECPADAGQAVNCTYIGNLASGESSEIRVRVTVNVARGSEVTNTAVVAASGPVAELDLTDNTDTASVAIGELPRTGSDLIRLAVVGLLMLAAGGALLGLAGRRRAIR